MTKKRKIRFAAILFVCFGYFGQVKADELDNLVDEDLPFDYPPVVISPVQHLTIQVGETLNFQIPPDTFRDHEDGSTRFLRLHLLTSGGAAVSSLSWIQFNEETQTVHGTPQSEDMGSTQYSLIAVDHKGNTARTPLEVKVVSPPGDQPQDEGNTSEEEEILFNFSPFLKTSLGNLTINAGESLQFQIPSDTFYDFEDGDTRNLELNLLTSESLGVPPGDWLQMDTQTQTLLGTPGTLDVGIHQYILVAMDTGGKIAKDVFQVIVLSDESEEENVFDHSPELKRSLGRLVLQVRDTLNYQIPRDTFYDVEEGYTRNLHLILLTRDGSTLPPDSWIRFDRETQTLYGTPEAEDVGTQLYNLFAMDRDGRLARDLVQVQVLPISEVNTTQEEEPSYNFPPFVRNSIDMLVVRIGENLNFQIPSDTFYDYEDGNTRSLNLTLFTPEGTTLPEVSWIHFNAVTQTIYGTPEPGDIGREHFLLVATDNHGDTATDVFEVVMHYNMTAMMCNLDQMLKVLAKNRAVLHPNSQTRHTLLIFSIDFAIF